MKKKEEKKYELKFNKDYYVVTANDLIKSKQRLTNREADLLYIAMAQVVKEDNDFKTYTTTVPELAEFMGIDTNSLYRDLKNICDSLMGRKIYIQRDEINDKGKKKTKWQILHWIAMAEYDDGKLTIRLSDEIKPYLVELVSHYTQTVLGTLCSFKSFYTKYLYQLILCEAREHPKKPKEEWTITCDQLRTYFNVKDKEYKRNYDLIKKTIKPAIDELNNSDFAYIWDYQEVHNTGRGRSLIGVSFKAILFKNKEEKEWYFKRALPEIERLREKSCELLCEAQ